MAPHFLVNSSCYEAYVCFVLGGGPLLGIVSQSRPKNTKTRQFGGLLSLLPVYQFLRNRMSIDLRFFPFGMLGLQDFFLEGA
jgi:hypothetical protein